MCAAVRYRLIFENDGRYSTCRRRADCVDKVEIFGCRFFRRDSKLPIEASIFSVSVIQGFTQRGTEATTGPPAENLNSSSTKLKSAVQPEKKTLSTKSAMNGSLHLSAVNETGVLAPMFLVH
jgi:hypothetical protein